MTAGEMTLSFSWNSALNICDLDPNIRPVGNAYKTLCRPGAVFWSLYLNTNLNENEPWTGGARLIS